MHSRESSRFTAPLAERVAEGADSLQIAEAIRALWLDVEKALRPVLGDRGVAALFKRALHVAATKHLWLAPLKTAADDDAVDVDRLAALVAASPPSEAIGAGTAVFENFRELLITLIGASLSERLLRNAWSTITSAPPAQDPI